VARVRPDPLGERISSPNPIATMGGTSKGREEREGAYLQEERK